MNRRRISFGTARSKAGRPKLPFTERRSGSREQRLAREWKERIVAQIANLPSLDLSSTLCVARVTRK